MGTMKRVAPIKRSQSDKIKPIFGRPLEDLYTEGGGLPSVFWDTLRLLSLKALTVPGLFRGQAVPRSGRRMLSASHDTSRSSDDNGEADSGRKVLLCKRLYDTGQDALKTLPSVQQDMHAVAGVLKLWVASLPEPVVPVTLYADAVATQQQPSRDSQVAALHVLLRRCEHRVLQVLYPMMEFLHHYCLNQRNARAERQELSRIFAPLVLRPANRSVMAQSQDGGAPAACVEHMIREYRTLFVARKRAIVPPALPTSKPGTPPGAAAAGAAAAKLGLETAVIAPLEAPETAMKPSSASPISSPQLRVKVSSPTKGEVEAHSVDDLPDSPMSDADMYADPQLEAAVSELLFSSTSVLFAGPPPVHSFFVTSPESSPESSPTRESSLADARNAESGRDAKMDGEGGESDEGAKSADSVLPDSPNSIPGGWAAMSDADDCSGGSGDEAPAEAERTRAAAAVFGSARAYAQHSSLAVQQQASKCARVLAWDTPSSAAAAAAAAQNAADFAAVDEDMYLTNQPSGPLDGQHSLLQPPSDVVQYDSPSTVPEEVAQLAAEKAALKRQLRQLDADFEASTGRAPGRAEKEALRPLYVRYWRLKRALQLAAQHPEQPQPSGGPAGTKLGPIQMEA